MFIDTYYNYIHCKKSLQTISDHITLKCGVYVNLHIAVLDCLRQKTICMNRVGHFFL